jgi:non-ribosomal peptide synthetase component E (peptide arylation enzyme)
MAKDVNREHDWWGADLLGRHADSAIWAQALHSVTYQTLRTRVASLRPLFDAHGIRPGDTVALQGAHSFSQLWTLFALWSRGVQVMLLGPQLGGHELDQLLDRCRPQFYVSFDAPGHGRETFHDECEIFVRPLVGGRRARTGWAPGCWSSVRWRTPSALSVACCTP